MTRRLAVARAERLSSCSTKNSAIGGATLTVTRFSVAALLTLQPPAVSGADRGIVAFHGEAERAAASPPAESRLRIVVAREIGGRHMTFLGTSRGVARIVVMSATPVLRPERELKLKAAWVAPPPEVLGELVAVDSGRQRDWAWIYDRNRDGRVDYLVHVLGPLPVRPDSFPADFPSRGEPLSPEQLTYQAVTHMRYAFTHVADDDFDGRVDGLVMGELDPERDWIQRWLLVRSTSGGGTADTAWRFRREAGEDPMPAPRAAGGFAANLPGGAEVAGDLDLATWTRALATVNDAVEACGLKASRIPARP